MLKVTAVSGKPMLKVTQQFRGKTMLKVTL
jgi:hypothetical protein